jgi:hypothetical protein
MRPGRIVYFDFDFRKDKRAEEIREAKAREANKSHDLI